MSTAIIDAREWQNVLDLRTGRKITDDSPDSRVLKKILKDHPYPGDMNEKSNSWVTDTALDMVAGFDPDFAFLMYSDQFYSFRFNCPPQAERGKMIDAVFAEAERFARESGFITVIAGTGDMVPVTEFIDLTVLNGLAVASHWQTRFAGLYSVDMEDIIRLNKIPGIEKLSGKDEFISMFADAHGDKGRLPDYLIKSKEGYCFRSAMLRMPRMIPAENTFIPVSNGIGAINCITDICRSIESAAGKKVALILLEGIGIRDFRIPYTKCLNGRDWFYYEPGGAQYLTISTGNHHAIAYPAGIRSYSEDDENKEYPLSGYFSSMPEGTIGRRIGGKSIAAGNRSMFMHTVSGADIAVECFARNLSNQGCLGVIHR